MGRKGSDNRLDEITAYIQDHGDQKAGTIASALGMDNKSMMRALSQLEDRGDMLSEDDAGRLSWFGWRR